MKSLNWRIARFFFLRRIKLFLRALSLINPKFKTLFIDFLYLPLPKCFCDFALVWGLVALIKVFFILSHPFMLLHQAKFIFINLWHETGRNFSSCVFYFFIWTYWIRLIYDIIDLWIFRAKLTGRFFIALEWIIHEHRVHMVTSCLIRFCYFICLCNTIIPRWFSFRIFYNYILFFILIFNNNFSPKLFFYTFLVRPFRWYNFFGRAWKHIHIEVDTLLLSKGSLEVFIVQSIFIHLYKNVSIGD